MAEPKTKKNKASVTDFLNTIDNPKRKEDALLVLDWMTEISGFKPVMWGTNIIGFGSYHYVYASGREGDWPKLGFSPRKQSLSIYIMPGFDRFKELMDKLGKFTTGKSCLYVKKIEDVDQDVLKELIRESIAYMNEKYDS